MLCLGFAPKDRVGSIEEKRLLSSNYSKHMCKDKFKISKSDILFYSLCIHLFVKLVGSNLSIMPFPNCTKLPIIPTVFLGFYGYTYNKEQAANLLFLAQIQSPLIKSLSSLRFSLCRQLLLDWRAHSLLLCILMSSS